METLSRCKDLCPEEVSSKVNEKLISLNLGKAREESEEILSTLQHLDIDEDVDYSLETPFGYFESPKEFEANAWDGDNLRYLPNNAVSVVIENRNGKLILLERREHRAIFGGWRTSGVLGTREQRTFYSQREGRVYSLPMNHESTAIRELEEELKVSPKDIDELSFRGNVVDVPLNFILDVYSAKISEERLDKENLSRKEMVGMDYCDKNEIGNREVTPASLASVELCYNKDFDAPYLENYNGQWGLEVFYPGFFPHSRPEVTKNMSYEKIFKLSKESAREILEK